MHFKFLIVFLLVNIGHLLAQNEPIVFDSDWVKASQNEEAIPNNKIDLNDLDAYHQLCPKILSIDQINAIHLHCAEYGPLQLLQELQTIQSCQSIDLFSLNHYIQNKSIHQEKQQINCISFCNVIPMPLMNGFSCRDSNRFLGNNQKNQLAVKWSNEFLSLRFQAEKDAGEPWQYSSIFGSITYFHKKQMLILGDQHLVLGQGLILGSKQTFFNSLNFQMIQHINSIKAKTDFAENGSVRGIGVSYQIRPKWSLQAVYGKYLLDLINNKSVIGNGLYRNPQEHSVKLKGSFNIWAFCSQFQIKKSSISLNVHNDISISFKLPLSHWYCFGEIAPNRMGSKYLIGGMRSFGQHLDLGISVKHLPNKNTSTLMQSLYAVFDNAASEYNFICQIKPIKHISLKSQFCIAKYFPNSHIQQFERYWQCYLSYKLNKQTELICLFKNQNDNTFSQSNRASKNSIKCQLSFENFQLHQITELQIKTSPKRTDFSYCLAHKLSFNMNKLFKINLMVASFNTFDNPESIYLYENNIPGQQTVFSYNHKGIHWYVMLQTKSIKDLIFWFRFATSTYAQEQTFGSGLDAITGVRKSTLSTGVKWKL